MRLLSSLLLVWASLQPGLAAGTTVQVLSVSPAPHAVGVGTGFPITLVFDVPVKASTVNNASVQVFGTWSGVTDVRYTVAPDGLTLIITPREALFPGEQVTVNLSAGLRGTQGETLPPGGFITQYWTAPVPTGLSFSNAGVISMRVPGEGFIRSYGIYAGDLDDDGAPDIIVPNEVSHDVRVLMNDGCGVYSAPDIHPVTGFSSPSANIGQDFDRDGSLDFATAGWSAAVLEVLLGDGAGSLAAPISVPVGTTPRGLAALDVEGDGDQDLITANRTSSNMSLLLNDGKANFSQGGTFEGGGGGETSVVAADSDNDGAWDLFVAHYASSEVSVLRGDGTGAFSVADLDGVGLQPWMLVSGDLDGDGFVDTATTDSGSDTASILLNDGLGTLALADSLVIGDFSVAIDFGDLDGDGDLDLVTSSFADKKWIVYVNGGAGDFANPFELPSNMSGSCASLVDYDRDGTLDIVGMDEIADEITFWRHDTPPVLGVQPASCRATLRIDNLGNSAGYGSQPPQSIGLGDGLHVGITAAPNTGLVILGGVPMPSGASTAGGLLNLATGWTVLLFRTTDSKGEYAKRFVIPSSAPFGLDVGMQVLADDPAGLVLSNPHVLRITP
jgi:hypothetical protein